MVFDLLSTTVHEVCLSGDFSSSVLLSDADRCHLLRVTEIAILPRLSLIAIVRFAHKNLVSIKPMENLLRGGIRNAGRLHVLLSSRTSTPIIHRIGNGIWKTTMFTVSESVLDVLSGTQARQRPDAAAIAMCLITNLAIGIIITWRLEYLAIFRLLVKVLLLTLRYYTLAAITVTLFHDMR